MKQDNKDKLKGNVDTDETLVVGYTNKNKGGSLESKEALLLATEKLADGRTGNIRMKPIENFKALKLKFALQDMIDKEAIIKEVINTQIITAHIGVQKRNEPTHRILQYGIIIGRIS